MLTVQDTTIYFLEVPKGKYLSSGREIRIFVIGQTVLKKGAIALVHPLKF